MRFLQRYAGSSEAVRRLLADWMAWIFCYLPFSHVVRLLDCYLMEGEKVCNTLLAAARQKGGNYRDIAVLIKGNTDEYLEIKYFYKAS